MPRLITIAICFLLSLVLVLFLVGPKYQLLSFSKSETRNRETELQYVEEYFVGLQETSQKIKEYKEELAKIESALPSDASIPSIFNFLKKISTENGLFIKKFGAFSITSFQGREERQNSSAGKTDLALKTVSLPIQLSGSYPALKNFLFALENSTKIFEVNSVSFSSEEEGIFTFDFEIETYSY